ncbi:MAG TPA: hypothetical protein VEX38_01740, partial [Fimbriimonadaceae bacterium]|nr:hypothetical protein [Fimbriimonadaceae bacterium]
MSSPLLTKTLYLAGLHCPKKAWLCQYRADLVPEHTAVVLDRMQVGKEIGKLAHDLFPEGVMPPYCQEASEAAMQTQRLLQGDRRPIFEGTFLADGMHVKVDVLSPDEEDGWELNEVKSGTAKDPGDIKSENLHDLAFQRLVLRKAGTDVARANLILVDSSLPSNGLPPLAGSFLKKVDVTRECELIADDVRKNAESFKSVLSGPEPPRVEPNTHCKGCDFDGHCNEHQHPRDVVFLPRIQGKTVTKLRQDGFATIDSIPDGRLKGNHEIARQVILT